MITKELLDYIKQAKNGGQTNEQIKAVLVQNGWDALDVEEAFRQNSAASFNMPTPPEKLNLIEANSQKSYKTLLVFLIIIFVLILGGGGALAYRYKDDLTKIPILGSLLPKQIVVEIDSTPKDTQTENQTAPDVVPMAETGPVVVPEIKTGAVVSGVIDCGVDTVCFIKAANNCQKVKFIFSVKEAKIPLMNIGTIDITSTYEITGKENNNCVSKSIVTDYVLKYNQDIIDSFLKEGKTQADIAQGEKEMRDATIGTGQKCKLDLAKKIGDALYKDIFNYSLEKTGIDCNISSGSCSHPSGLKCEAIAK